MIRALQDLVTAQAERRPRAFAIVTDDAELTYADVERASRKLAVALREVGCKEGSRVCLFLPASPWAIVAMIAVLRTGGVYVPIDVRSPAVRVARIVEACEPTALLAAGPATDLLAVLSRGGPPAAKVPIGWLDRPLPPGGPFTPTFGLADVAACPDTLVPCATVRSHPAHILFTTEPTGAPSGVVTTHENLLRFVEWATRHLGMEPSDRVSGCSPLHFDLSTFDVYGAFAAGAELHLAPPTVSASPHDLAAFIRDRGLTQWSSVPAALAYLARGRAVTEDDFPRLRRLLWCGEISTHVLIHWMRRLPHVRFTGLYGPTETTIASSHHDVPACPEDERAPVPIGRPCAGEDLLVLDGDLSPVPQGQTGDLYIAGVGLSPGYWRDPEKTEQAFVLRASAGGSIQRIYRTGDLARVGGDGLVYLAGRSDARAASSGR